MPAVQLSVPARGGDRGDICSHPFPEAEELYQKRVLTITGICIALLVVGIMCVVAYCKTKKQRKKLHDRLRQSLRSERNNMANMANGPHHPNPPPENVQLVNPQLNRVKGCAWLTAGRGGLPPAFRQ
ncbi:hypothetical protein CB1_015160009 [Camelus ferus]|nr:hypothetical protein CB1_015160009 [Camelus ferus]